MARIVLLVAVAAACTPVTNDVDRPSVTIADDGASSGGSDDASTPCIPGLQISCACPGGLDGAQACRDDGSGYDACVCPEPDGGGTTDAATTSTGADETTSGDDGDPSHASVDGETATSSTGGNTECEPNDANVCDDCMACVIKGPCGEAYMACAAYEECAASVNCVLDCGFDQGCVDPCAPVQNDEASNLYWLLVGCVTEQCPQCGL